MKNSFGQLFRMTSFGESHGVGLGVVIDGCPAGVSFDEEFLQTSLNRRRPGGKMVSGRKELDQAEVLSGVFAGKTLGTPIAIMVRNVDQRSEDYQEISRSPRPGHADDTWKNKYGHSDHRGGGRSSGRETVARVMAGAVAEMFLCENLKDYQAYAYAKKMGPLTCEPDVLSLSREKIDQHGSRFPDTKQQEKIEELLLGAKKEGKSYGGVAELILQGVPKGLGQPVFHKLRADLAFAMMSIGATAGVEFGEGFSSSDQEGSEFHKMQSPVYGGIRGGISTGEPVCLRVAFKPTSSVMDVAKKGRHDPCIVPRAIPVMEAMASLVIADHLLWQRTDR